MHTKKSIIKALKEEYQSLSKTNWESVGDIDLIGEGGLEYCKSNTPGEIKIIFYCGVNDLPSDIPDMIESTVELNDLIDCIDDIWTLGDLGNCGLNIGWAVYLKQSYDGFLNYEGGWKFSEEAK